MKKMTPPVGEVVRNMPASFTHDVYSPFSLRQQILIKRFHLAPAVASAMSVAVFGEAR
jgi:hypothetical protein